MTLPEFDMIMQRFKLGLRLLTGLIQAI